MVVYLRRLPISTGILPVFFFLFETQVCFLGCLLLSCGLTGELLDVDVANRGAEVDARVFWEDERRDCDGWSSHLF